MLLSCFSTTSAQIKKPSDKSEQIESVDTNSEKVSFSETQNSSAVKNQLYFFTVAGPEKVELNEPFWCDATLTCIQNIENAIVKIKIPAGLEYIESLPAATHTDNYLYWKFINLSQNEIKKIKIKYIPKAKRVIKVCGNAQMVAKDCFTTTVTKPVISIQKNGPETALLGEVIPYTILVKNNGDGVARNVVIKDTIPSGLEHSSKKKEIIARIGALAPGEGKNIKINLKTIVRGKHCNKVRVDTSNAGTSEDTACTTVLLQDIYISKTGTKKQFLNKRAKYAIVVKNPADVSLHDVVVKDTIPSETTLLSAPQGKVEGKTIIWNIAKLDPGKSETFNIVLTSTKAGTHVNYADVQTREGLRRKTSAKTLWEGFAALLIEVIDTVDPLLIGDQGKYIIKVTNQGTAKDTNIKITAVLPNEITPLTAKGATRATISSDGRTVSFAPCPSLAPKQTLTYEINVKAKSIGDARIKVLLKSDLIKTPVTEEESTHVY